MSYTGPWFGGRIPDKATKALSWLSFFTGKRRKPHIDKMAHVWKARQIRRRREKSKHRHKFLMRLRRRAW